jgi:4-cresol dehydrogenase (hydroxylating) flavoprotein subunit
MDRRARSGLEETIVTTSKAATSGAPLLAPALDQMRAALGAPAVITDPAALSAYLDAGSLAGPDAAPPAAAVMPSSVEHIRRLLTIAGEHRLALWPLVGSGRFAAPRDRAAGIVVVDQRRMNHILDVNEEFAYALVEPAVTYAQLHARLRGGKPQLWLDCASLVTGSPADDFLNRSFGSTPYNDHVMMQCGMESVMPDGSVVRTGMGAMPKSSSWQLFKYGYGPYVDGSFTQSSLSIVTKVGIWLMPAPPACKPFMVTVPREEDLHQVMETLKPLKITMLIPSTVVVAHVLCDAALAAPRAKYFSGTGAMPAGSAKKIAGDLKRGMWNVYGALYGLPVGIEAAWKAVEGAFRKIPNANCYSLDDRKGDAIFEYRAQLMCGVPAASASGAQQWRGGGYANLSQVAPLTGSDAVRAFDMVQRITRAHGFDYPSSFVATWRTALLSGTVAFDPKSADDRKRARECAKAIVTEMAGAGYGTVGAPAELVEAAAATYSAHNGALWKVHRKLKAELDPRGLIASALPVAPARS